MFSRTPVPYTTCPYVGIRVWVDFILTGAIGHVSFIIIPSITSITSIIMIIIIIIIMFIIIISSSSSSSSSRCSNNIIIVIIIIGHVSSREYLWESKQAPGPGALPLGRRVRLIMKIIITILVLLLLLLLLLLLVIIIMLIMIIMITPGPGALPLGRRDCRGVRAVVRAWRSILFV